MHRRNFLKNSSTLIGMLPFLQSQSIGNINYFFSMDNVVKVNVGRIKCTFFKDMMFKYLAKDYFINANGEDLNRSLDKYHLKADNIPSPFIAVLLEQDKRKVLVDTGIGLTERPIIFRGNSYEFKGQLHALLEQENVGKESITDVVITHFHPDHIGGIYSEVGTLNFPNAQFHMHEDEWNYWHSSQSQNQPPMFHFFIEKNISKLKGANLNLIKGDYVEFLPGVTAVKADGHTPGQIALIVHSDKEHMAYISDTFLHPLHIERLDWQTNYDWNHNKAKQSRIKLIELAHKESMLVNAFHFDFPGLGRIGKLNNNWRWEYVKS